MTDTKKFPRGGVPPERENALEGVSGGLTYKPPVYGSKEKSYICPVCGYDFINNIGDVRVGFPGRVQCPGCGRWLRLDGMTFVEEQP